MSLIFFRILYILQLRTTAVKIKDLIDGQFFLEWGRDWAISKNKFLHSKNCGEKNRASRAMGKNIEQVLCTIQVLCSTLKTFLLTVAHQKESCTT